MSYGIPEFRRPNGWIPLIESCEVTTEVRELQLFDLKLVAFRGISSKKVYVLDAYCPHLGANFSSGGTSFCSKNRDCIRCPFHSWTFDAETGLCTSVPYAKDTSKYKVYLLSLLLSTA